MLLSLDKKPKILTLRDRILIVLRQRPRGVGQTDLARELGMTHHLEFADLSATINSMLSNPPELLETKRQLPGTGHEGPPVYEYVYSALDSVKKA